MTDVDISPEAVEAVCVSLQRFLDSLGTKGIPSLEIYTLRALSAALQKSQAETAAVIDRAAQVAVNRRGVGADSMPHPYDAGYLAACDDIAVVIRSLTTLDQTAALDAVKAEVRADGMREAAGCCQVIVDESKAYHIPQMTLGAMSCRDAIIAAIPKGGVETSEFIAQTIKVDAYREDETRKIPIVEVMGKLPKGGAE